MFMIRPPLLMIMCGYYQKYCVKDAASIFYFEIQGFHLPERAGKNTQT